MDTREGNSNLQMIGDKSNDLYSELFDLNNKARDAKALSSAIADLPTPVLVLFGDQTSGKSSLVEALGYGIRLPRSDGTCTKAPLELRLHPGTSDDGCACRVSFRPEGGAETVVRTLTDEEVKDLQEDRVSQVVEDLTKFLLGKADTEMHLRWEHPIPKSKKVSVLSTYTSDAIILDIYNQPSPLTIVDLPGLIHGNAQSGATAQQSEQDAKFTWDLAESYMRNGDVINVLVLPGHRDYNLWAAYNLVARVDPTRERTIGVLTFGDVIMTKQSAKAQMLKVLDGKLCELKLGYYVVANQVGEESAGYETDRENELVLIQAAKKQDVQHNVFPRFEDRFGVHNLRKALSKLLAHKILSILKHYENMLNRLYYKTQAELQELKERRKPLSNPYDMGSKLLQTIQDRIRDNIFQLNLHHRKDALFADLMKNYEAFAASVRSTQPALVCNPGEKPVHTLEFEEDPYQEVLISKIREAVEGAATLARPGQSVPEAVQHLHDQHLKEWGGFAQECLRQATDLLRTYVAREVEAVTEGKEPFGRYVMEVLDKLITEAYSRTKMVLEDRAKQETDPQTYKTYIFTMHRALEKNTWEHNKKKLQEELNEHESYNDEPDFYRTSLPEIISHMAYVRTEWKIAYDRFVDNVPMEIRYHLLVDGFLMKVATAFSEAWRPGADTREEQMRLLDESPSDRKKLEGKEREEKELAALKAAFELVRQREDIADLFRTTTAPAPVATVPQAGSGAVARPTTPAVARPTTPAVERPTTSAVARPASPAAGTVPPQADVPTREFWSTEY